MNNALRIASATDQVLLSHIIGTAFADDPVSRWAMGSPALVADTFKALITHVYLPRGHCTLLGEQAAALWLAPGGRKQLPALGTYRCLDASRQPD